MKNSDLKIYLLNWYNFYETCHKVCNKEDNYRAKKTATASLDVLPTFKGIDSALYVRRNLTDFARTQTGLIQKLSHFINAVKKQENASINEENDRIKEELSALEVNKKSRLRKHEKIFQLIPIIVTIVALIGLVGFSIFLWSGFNSKTDSAFSCVLINILFIISITILWFCVLLLFAVVSKKRENRIEKFYANKIDEIKKSNKNEKILAMTNLFYEALYACKSDNLYVVYNSDNYYNLSFFLKRNPIQIVINEIKAYQEILNTNELVANIIDDLNRFLYEYEEFKIKINKSINNYIKLTKESIQELIKIREELRVEFPIPAKYENEQSIKALLSLALDGRCDTLKEAINLLEDEKFKSQILDSINTLNNNLTIQNQILVAGFTQLSIQQQQISKKLDNVNSRLNTIKNVTIANFLDD